LGAGGGIRPLSDAMTPEQDNKMQIFELLRSESSTTKMLAYRCLKVCSAAEVLVVVRRAKAMARQAKNPGINDALRAMITH
jgi:hypothetical protein